MIYLYVQVGVTSFVSSAGCESGNPHGFSRVAEHLEVKELIIMLIICFIPSLIPSDKKLQFHNLTFSVDRDCDWTQFDSVAIVGFVE